MKWSTLGPDESKVLSQSACTIRTSTGSFDKVVSGTPAPTTTCLKGGTLEGYQIQICQNRPEMSRWVIYVANDPAWRICWICYDLFLNFNRLCSNSKTGLRCAIPGIFANCAAIGSDDTFQHPATQLGHLSAREQMEGAAGEHCAVPSPEKGKASHNSICLMCGYVLARC